MPDLNTFEEFRSYLCGSASAEKWSRLGVKKRSGALVPLFSVYSRHSVSIGDFSDLKLLLDWCKLAGNSILQLLPMNEMGIVNCPYDSLTSFGLEPIYISLDRLLSSQDTVIKFKIDHLRQLYPTGRAHVNYGIKKEKLFLLWEIYARNINNLPADFHKFKEDNAYWLDDFALYKIIKGYQGYKPWYEWQEGFRYHEPSCLKLFSAEHEREVNFEKWIQWQLYLQLKDAKDYAAANGLMLKGDLPILVSRDSADVWAHPEFFKLEYVAGAPPDMYCAKGQRWGMPPYNWEAIVASGFSYVKDKLRYAQNFYDILRIDHVVGLFRIWSIPYNEPKENQGLNGFFDPRDEHLWGEHGSHILSAMLSSTDMLLCAEDLGVIPPACTETLKKLGIPGNDVARWVKDWNKRHDFLRPEECRALSVTMLSTHDTTNWPAWWENEAGTVDEALFIRKCESRGIDYLSVRDRLFDPRISRHGRLRWLIAIDSTDKFISVLGKRREDIRDFIDMYENSFMEKERLWGQLGIEGPMREASDVNILSAALKLNLSSNAIFSVQTIVDWLSLSGIFKGDPYQYRINTPGSITYNNWSLTVPINLEDLLRHPVCGTIKDMVKSSNRI